MIRHLQAHEAGLCIEGGFEFFSEGKLPVGFVPEVFVRSWKGLIETGRGVVIASFKVRSLLGEVTEEITGALGAVLGPDLNNGQLLATECFWYVRPGHRGHGILLLDEFERWAKERGAARAAMIHLERLQPEALRALYERRGYEKIETNYLKEL